LDDIKDTIEGVVTAFEEFKETNDERYKELSDQQDECERKLNYAQTGELKPIEKKGKKHKRYAAPPSLVDARTGRPLVALNHKMALADLPHNQPKKDEPKIDIGRFLRGVALGGRANDHQELGAERQLSSSISVDPSGGYTVSGWLASQWIDLLRSKLVLSQAGAVTTAMESGEVLYAKQLSDATAVWHQENASIADSDPTFGAVRLRAKTVVAVVKLSIELAQDSGNIDAMLKNSITQALSHAIDGAGLNGVAVGAAAAPEGIYNLPSRTIMSGVGALTNYDPFVDAVYNLLAANVPLENVGALVSHPKLWQKLRKLKTGISGDQTSLKAPEEVADLPKLFTTANPFTGGNTTKAIIAKWDDLLFGIRQAITVRVLDQAFFGSNLQLAILAYARVDFGATRPASFVTLEGITPV
jgi:HK97 family phage major capsid protein